MSEAHSGNVNVSEPHSGNVNVNEPTVECCVGCAYTNIHKLFVVGKVSKMAQDVGMVSCGCVMVLFPSSLVPSLHVLVFGKKTFLRLVYLWSG